MDSPQSNDISIYQLVQTDPEATTRLINVLEDCKHCMPHSSIVEFINDAQAYEKYKKLPSMGKKTFDLLEYIIKKNYGGNPIDFLLTHTSNDLINQQNKEVSQNHGHFFSELDSAKTIAEYINIVVDNALDQRERIVIDGRFSASARKKTLQQLGDELGVTRERIRQIEKSALLTIQRVSQRYDQVELDTRFKQELESKIFGTNTFVSTASVKKLLRSIDAKVFIYVKSLYGNMEKCLNSLFLYSYEFLGWFTDDNSYHEIGSVDTKRLSLDQSISLSSWPIRLDSLVRLSRQPESVLFDYIDNDKNLSIRVINDVKYVHIKKVNLKDAMRFILRKYKRAMTLYEIKEECLNLFKRKLSVGQVSNTLASIEDVLIVDRGIYNLFENLGISDSDIEMIRSKVEHYLQERQDYVSTKVIIKDLLKDYDQEHILFSINGYSLLGILQGDSRFITQRGLMAGLKSPCFTGSFLPLEEEIVRLMQLKERPLNIQEIVHEFSTRRELLVPSLQNMLESNDLFQQVSTGEYYLSTQDETSDSLDNSAIDEAIMSEWEIL